VTIFSKSFALSRPFRDCLAASLIWALSAAFCIPIFAASSAATTSNNLAALHVEQRNADEALHYIAFKSGLIIGVENVVSPDDGKVVIDFPEVQSRIF